MPDVYARALRRAAEIVGGVEQLAIRLNVPAEDVYMWIQRLKDVPTEIFLRAVDILSEDRSP